jgi:hypothetical protein
MYESKLAEELEKLDPNEFINWLFSQESEKYESISTSR